MPTNCQLHVDHVIATMNFLVIEDASARPPHPKSLCHAGGVAQVLCRFLCWIVAGVSLEFSRRSTKDEHQREKVGPRAKDKSVGKSTFGAPMKNTTFLGLPRVSGRYIRGPLQGCPERGFQGEKVVFAWEALQNRRKSSKNR